MKPITNCEQVTGGATAIEYGLIAGLISVAIIAALTKIPTGFGGITTKVS